MSNKKILILGGAGFIGVNFVISQMKKGQNDVLVFDKLSYCSNLSGLNKYVRDRRLSFVKGDICDRKKLREVFEMFCPTIVVNFAAETHVDRSIGAPSDFIQTNIIGTYNILETTREMIATKTINERCFILNISTDEVFGSAKNGRVFYENSPYLPNSPYSASKAASDHLVRSWYKTFSLNVITTNCANNFGPYQYPDKLVPLTIKNFREGKPVPVYGEGLQIRNWLYVEDHVKALNKIISNPEFGETFNIGSETEVQNLKIIETIFQQMKTRGLLNNRFKSLQTAPILHVDDRMGHDFQYSIASTKICDKYGWEPKMSFEKGISATIEWYCQNPLYAWGTSTE